jgi:hypothetical protein
MRTRTVTGRILVTLVDAKHQQSAVAIVLASSQR